MLKHVTKDNKFRLVKLHPSEVHKFINGSIVYIQIRQKQIYTQCFIKNTGPDYFWCLPLIGLQIIATFCYSDRSTNHNLATGAIQISSN